MLLVFWLLPQAEKLPKLFRQEGGRHVWGVQEGKERFADVHLPFQQRFDPIQGQCQDHVHVHGEMASSLPENCKGSLHQVRFGTRRAQTPVSHLRKTFRARQGLGVWTGP